MTMKKILMAAVAVSALTAGAANAITITGVKVSGTNLTLADPTAVPATAAKSLAIANSVVVGTAANVSTSTSTGDNTVKAKLSAATGGFYPGGSLSTTYNATYTLSGTGNPVFTQPVTVATLTATAVDSSVTPAATCAPSAPQAVSGGAIGSNSVTFAFTVNTGTGAGLCNTTNSPQEIAFDAPFKLTTVGTAIATIDFKVAQTQASYDGAAASHPLVITADPYVVEVKADTSKLTTLALTTGSAGYVSLKSTDANYDAVLGSLTVKNADAPTAAMGNTVYATLLKGPLPAITADASIAATSGNFAIITPKIGTSTSGVVSTTNNALFTDAPSAGLDLSTGSNVVVSIPSGNTTQISSAQTYTATLTPKLGAYTVLQKPAAVGPTALQTINLEGTSFLAPWMSGTQSANVSNIRISNNSSIDTGAITLSLKSPAYSTGTEPAVAPSQCTSTKLPALLKIAGNKELQIFSEDLKTCFGDFKRGDILITIQASSSNLTAKARITKGGVDSEVSLGSLDKSNVTF